MKTLKVMAGVVLLVIAIVVGVVFFALSNLNKIVKEAVETVGPDITKTTVLLDAVDIDIREGKGELNRFLLGNPEGFKTEHLLKWDTIRLQIDPASVVSDVVVIKDFTVEGVNINAEQLGSTTNLQALLKSLDSGGESAPKAESQEEGATPDVRLMIEKVRFADNAVNFVTEKYGDYTLDMPSFELSNIGDKNKGLTPEELAPALLKPLLKQAQKSVEDRVKEIAEGKLKEKLDEKKAEAKEKLEEKKAEAEAKLDEEKDALKQKLKEKEDKLGEDAKDKLKGLFKRD